MIEKFIITRKLIVGNLTLLVEKTVIMLVRIRIVE